MTYDVIGDVHGQAALLENLLGQLGYEQDPDGIWGNDLRKALFLGDLINKGPEIRRTVSIVRKMAQKGNCACIIGNHEWAWITGNGPAIQDTLDAYGEDYPRMEEDLEWVMTLPLWIEFEHFRLVHAFWDPRAISILEAYRRIHPDWRQIGEGSVEERAAFRLLKGPYYHPAPDEHILQNGLEMSLLRLRWWNLDLPLYDPSEKLLFFGHYCMSDGPLILPGNICCLDSCVHRTGRLSAYSWSGESVLNDTHLHVMEA